MEINLVVLNVGNSRLAVGPFTAGELGEVERIELDRRDEWSEAIERAWRRPAGGDNASGVPAGVNPKMEAAVDDAVLSALDPHVVWVGRALDLPIKVLTD